MAAPNVIIASAVSPRLEPSTNFEKIASETPNPTNIAPNLPRSGQLIVAIILAAIANIFMVKPKAITVPATFARSCSLYFPSKITIIPIAASIASIASKPLYIDSASILASIFIESDKIKIDTESASSAWPMALVFLPKISLTLSAYKNIAAIAAISAATIMPSPSIPWINSLVFNLPII